VLKHDSGLSGRGSLSACKAGKKIFLNLVRLAEFEPACFCPVSSLLRFVNYFFAYLVYGFFYVFHGFFDFRAHLSSVIAILVQVKKCLVANFN
jgi:hypothetical protein